MTTDKIALCEAVIENRKQYVQALDVEREKAEQELEAGTLVELNGGPVDTKRREAAERLLAGLPHRRAAAEKAIAGAERDLARAQGEARMAEAEAVRGEMQEMSGLALVLALQQVEHKRRDRDIGLVMRGLSLKFQQGQAKLSALGDHQPVRWSLETSVGGIYEPVWTRDPSPEAVASRIRQRLKDTATPQYAKKVAATRLPDAVADLAGLNGAVPASVHQILSDTKAALARALREEGVVKSR